MADLEPTSPPEQAPKSALTLKLDGFFSDLRATWTDLVAQVSSLVVIQTHHNGNSFAEDRREVLLRIASQTYPVPLDADDPRDSREPQLSAPAEARRVSHKIVCLALGDDPSRAGDLQRAPHNLDRIRRATRLFIEAAAVFVGDLEGGPGAFELQKMRRFLGGKGLWELAERPGVGRQLLPTLGAVAAGLETGRFKLKELVGTAPVSDKALFRRAVEYARSGRLQAEVTAPTPARPAV